MAAAFIAVEKKRKFEGLFVLPIWGQNNDLDDYFIVVVIFVKLLFVGAVVIDCYLTGLEIDAGNCRTGSVIGVHLDLHVHFCYVFGILVLENELLGICFSVVWFL